MAEPCVAGGIDGAQLAEVLAYVHGKDVVHHDLKPSNVLGDGPAPPTSPTSGSRGR